MDLIHGSVDESGDSLFDIGATASKYFWVLIPTNRGRITYQLSEQ